MTKDRSLFKVFEFKKGGNVTFDDGIKSQIKGKGTISLPGLLDITNVLYVEGLRVNLLSISQICDQDFMVLFSKGKYLVLNESRKKLISGVRTLDNCYGLELDVDIVYKHLSIVSKHESVLGIPKLSRDRENVEKFDSRSNEGIFLRYSSTSKAYRVYNKRTKKVMETVNIVIDEASDFGSEKSSEDIPMEILPSEPKVVQEKVNQEPVSPSTPSVVEVSVDIPTSPESESHEEKGPSSRIKLNHTLEVIVKPIKVEDALEDESWVKAMHDELL
ncbi:uncharacterized protein LOC115970515 [Quercus lobata]|uniref:uncharacterized protein LOC115970515 n=1 Tax=Quercus lobata TaxID=97700 RepID=UPI00124695D6|nr:uncharacterized protein LOC115970515 [Quercus lobata]